MAGNRIQRFPATSPNLPAAVKEYVEGGGDLRYVADKIKTPPRPDLGPNVWRFLRHRYYRYLRYAKPDEPVSRYVADVSREEEAILKSDTRRQVELSVDGQAVEQHVKYAIGHMNGELDCVRQSAAILLKRLVYAHLHEEGPLVMGAFEASASYLEQSVRRKIILERALASEIMAHAAPFLPAHFPMVYRVALMLRNLVDEQHNDAAAHAHAYHGLIHCFAQHHRERAGGLMTFERLAVEGNTRELKDASGDVVHALLRANDGHAGRTPPPDSSSGGGAGWDALWGAPYLSACAALSVPLLPVFSVRPAVIPSPA